MKTSKEYTAYKTKDIEGDSCCERVLLFDKDEDVLKFFDPTSKAFLMKFTDPEDPEEDKEVYNFQNK